MVRVLGLITLSCSFVSFVALLVHNYVGPTAFERSLIPGPLFYFAFF